MSRIPLFVLALGAMAAVGCAASAERAVPVDEADAAAIAKLAWVEAARPDSLVRESIAAGRYEFLAVCGIGCGTPAVGALTQRRCYPDFTARTIDDTGDVVKSVTHERLKRRAFELAEHYNRGMLIAADSLGMRSCGPSERWEGLWQALDEAVSRGDARNGFAGVRATEPIRFQLHFNNPAYIDTRLPDRICRIPPQHGIVTRVEFDVTSGDATLGEREHEGFACAAGRSA